MVGLKLAGWSGAQIGAAIQRDSGIKKWYKKCTSNSFVPRKGAPRKATERVVRRVILAATQTSLSCAAIAANLDVDIKRQTVNNILKQAAITRRSLDGIE